MKDNLDRFYTKPEIAVDLLTKTSHWFDQIKLIIEPAAGMGAFLNILSIPTLALDLDPQHPDITKGDWFSFNKQDLVNVAVIGNPPFGNRNKLSTGFVKHALQIPGVKIIAFVLPTVWQKPPLQKVFPWNWSLVQEVNLPKNSFRIKGQDYDIPTVFQVWAHGERPVNLRWPQNSPLECGDFYFGSKEDCDFFILGSAPHTIKDVKDVSPNNRGYYLKHKETSPLSLTQLKKRIQLTPWSSHGKTSAPGGVFWMTKPEIIKTYNDCQQRI